MFWNRYLAPMVIVLVVVSVLNWIGGEAGFYWTLSWYDWPVHFLGGVWAALFLLWAAFAGFVGSWKRYLTPRNIVIAVFAIGIAWEVLELSLGFTDLHAKGYVFDTAHDLFNDMFGAFVVAFIVKKNI